MNRAGRRQHLSSSAETVSVSGAVAEISPRVDEILRLAPLAQDDLPARVRTGRRTPSSLYFASRPLNSSAAGISAAAAQAPIVTSDIQ